MTKKGPLSKAEKFYIENNRSSVDALCKDLDRAKSTINKFLKTLPEVVETEDETKKESFGLSQFARNGKGSTVMTENASQMGDERRRVGTPERTRKCTIKVRENDG